MKNLVIFGCGYHGRAAYRVLKNNKKNFLGWVDNDKKKHFKKLFRKTIFPVQQLKNLNFTDIIFCCFFAKFAFFCSAYLYFP